MKPSEYVRRFEEAFAEYVGAKYCIALCNGTATLHTALVALGVKPGDRVAVPPLTMSATTIAVLQAGAVPVFVDVDPDTWVLGKNLILYPRDSYQYGIPVNLYGLWCDSGWPGLIEDAAQTLRKHSADSSFTSYSFQASKILALGEGGMLATNDEEYATWAREFSSLGYSMRADQPRIDPATLKHPSFERHHTYPSWNYRMNDLTAARGLEVLGAADTLLGDRSACAIMYRQAARGCDWLQQQRVPEEWEHDWWTWAVAADTPYLAETLSHAVHSNRGEKPYAAWRLTYQEPAFRHLAADGCCPVAESLQPRLVQFQTNNLASAERNAEALRLAIREIGGAR